jgi:hypothetical protein
VSDLALRLAEQAQETAAVAAEALTTAVRALQAEQQARRVDQETAARRLAAVEATLARTREDLAEAESARERAEDALREARSHDPDVRARRSAAAAGWSLVGGILREGRVRSAIIAFVAALLLAASVGLAHLSGVDSSILSAILGSPDAHAPHP